MTMDELLRLAFKEVPRKPLYHYTSLKGLRGILESGHIYATDTRFLNDSSEIKYAYDLIRHAAHSRVVNKERRDAFEQLGDWLDGQKRNGDPIFVTSFTEEGNLLSQWRGYTEPGKGVSIAFSCRSLRQSLSRQSIPFRLGRCIYDYNAQLAWADGVVDVIEKAIDTLGPAPDSECHRTQSYYHCFDHVAPSVTMMSALIKDFGFSEEREWRLVSDPVANFIGMSIKYREGRSSLIPYVEFDLERNNTPTAGTGLPGVKIEDLYIGPTPHEDEAYRAITMYLARYNATPDLFPSLCGMPFRSW